MCSAVRTGAPRPLRAPVTETSLRRYGTAAASVAGRTMVSLRRLGAQATEQSAVQRVVDDYQRLEKLYAAASRLTVSRTNEALWMSSLSLAEQRAGVDANASGLGGCAPLAPSVWVARR